MKKGFYYILIVFLIGQLVACSTKKNTWTSRSYHAFNSRYNIYFNGKTSFDEALKSMNDNYAENYTEMIHMYPISALPKDKETPGGPFDRPIEKGDKAIKLHSIRTKPVKKPGWRNNPKQVALQQKEEYNPFLKHCWLLIAKSQFYNADFLQASSTFSYIARHYRDEKDVVAEARLWRARCYAELDWLYESELAFKQLKDDGLQTLVPKDFNRYYADFLLKSDSFQYAPTYLQQAIKSEKNGKQKARLKYLLGQVYMELDRNTEAYKIFNEVSGALNAPYPLSFAARMRQAEVIPPGQEQSMLRKLGRMTRSEKNKELLDQVYTARGDIYLSMKDTVNAIENYRLGVEKGTQSGLEMAICMIRLGDLYFVTQDYIKAQPCFSGALGIIEKKHEEYERIAKLSAALDELVVHVEAVHLQDSLQMVAKLPEPERMALIDKIIADLIKREKEEEERAKKEEYLANQDAMGTGLDRPGTAVTTPGMPTGESGSFYFYNPQTVAQGKTQFQNRWGRRPLEDHWRRKNKAINLFEETDEEVADEEQQETEEIDLTAEERAIADSIAVLDSLASDPHNREFYIQQLPFTAEDIDASNIIIADGLFNMGMIYKDKLEDFPLSVQTFNELGRRFPDNGYRLDYYFQEFLIGLRTKDEALTASAKNRLMTHFPDADYTKSAMNPSYEYDMRVMNQVQDSLYQQTYNDYLTGDTTALRRNYRLFDEKYSLGTLMPKFMFLNALSYVQAGDSEGFKEALKQLIEKYPGQDVTELASEMMKGLLAGKQLMQGSMTTMTWNLRFGGGGALSAEDSARVFTDTIPGRHRMILIYPTGVVDRNQLLFVVAAYNFANFKVKSFDMTFEDVPPLSMLQVSGFDNMIEVLEYYRMIYDAGGYAKDVEDFITFLPISDDNYQTLMKGKTLEEYILFFDEHFGHREPRVGAKWKARMEIMEEETGEYPDPAPPVIIVDGIDDDTLEEELPFEEPIESLEEAERDSVPDMAPLLPLTTDTIPLLPEGEGVWLPDSLTIEGIDSIEQVVPEEITLKFLEERRKRLEAEEKAEQEEAAKLREEQLKEREKELEDREKERAELQKQKERERAEKMKAAERERKEKEKARARELKEKEKARKEQLKQKERERKQKEKERQQQLREKEKARKASLRRK